MGGFLIIFLYFLKISHCKERMILCFTQTPPTGSKLYLNTAGCPPLSTSISRTTQGKPSADRCTGMTLSVNYYSYTREPAPIMWTGNPTRSRKAAWSTTTREISTRWSPRQNMRSEITVSVSLTSAGVICLRDVWSLPANQASGRPVPCTQCFCPCVNRCILWREPTTRASLRHNFYAPRSSYLPVS